MKPGYFVSTPTSISFHRTRKSAILMASTLDNASVIREAEDKPGVPAGKRDDLATREAARLRQKRAAGKAPPVFDASADQEIAIVATFNDDCEGRKP